MGTERMQAAQSLYIPKSLLEKQTWVAAASTLRGCLSTRQRLCFEETTKINCLVTVKHELLLVGPMTILHFSHMVAKSTFKLLLDRWWWGMVWLTNVASSSLFFVLTGFSPPLLLSLVWGTQLKTMSFSFSFTFKLLPRFHCSRCMWIVENDRPSPSLFTCTALPLPCAALPLPFPCATLPLPLPLHCSLALLFPCTTLPLPLRCSSPSFGLLSIVLQSEQWRVNYNSLSIVHVNSGECLHCSAGLGMCWTGSTQ